MTRLHFIGVLRLATVATLLMAATGRAEDAKSSSASSSAPASDIGFQADRALSERYTSNFYSLSDDSLIGGFNGHDHLLIDVHQLSRTFKNGPTLTDRGGTLGYVYGASGPYYVENSLIINPDALFMPRVSLSTTPHVVRSLWNRDWDLSLGIMANRYAVLNAVTLHPRVLCDSDSFYFGVGLFLTRTYDNLVATDLSAGLHLTEKQKISTSFSFGRTIEDQGIEDTFHAFSFQYQFKLWRDVYLGPAVQLYRGDLRSEDNYSVRVDVKI